MINRLFDSLFSPKDDLGETGAPGKEIEITPEMIDEGVDELKGEYFNLFPGGDLYPQIVRNVFVRMMEASRKYLKS